MIIVGIYEEKLKTAQQDKKIEYKFIPRTYLDEQLANSDVSFKMANIFNNESPWYDRTLGVFEDVNVDKSINARLHTIPINGDSFPAVREEGGRGSRI